MLGCSLGLRYVSELEQEGSSRPLLLEFRNVSEFQGTPHGLDKAPPLNSLPPTLEPEGGSLGIQKYI